MIEKKIHYCWFGGKEKPKLAQDCIESWRKFFPDYEIIEWNEENFDIACNAYCKEAYEAKKWAFVTDFVRLYVVYHHGGIYFDTDVEVIRSFEDVVDQAFYLGMESEGRINTGIGFGAERRSPIVKAMLDQYDYIHYVDPEGKENQTVCPVYNTRALKTLGAEFQKETIQFMGGTIYAVDYFSPIGLYDGKLRVTENTHSIHHFSNSWMSTKQRIQKKMYRNFAQNVLYPLTKWIKKVLHVEGSLLHRCKLK